MAISSISSESIFMVLISVPLQYGSVPDRHNMFYFTGIFYRIHSFIVGFKVRNLGNYLVAARWFSFKVGYWLDAGIFSCIEKYESRYGIEIWPFHAIERFFFVLVGYNDVFFFILFSSIEVLALVIKFLTAAIIRYFVVFFWMPLPLTEVESLWFWWIMI
jgi:hypothetical protein